MKYRLTQGCTLGGGKFGKVGDEVEYDKLPSGLLGKTEMINEPKAKEPEPKAKPKAKK
jgi:hypothetical protein